MAVASVLHGACPGVRRPSRARSITRSITAAIVWSKLWFGITGTPWDKAWLFTHRWSLRMFVEADLVSLGRADATASSRAAKCDR